jgi:hypothetical protein
MKLNSKPLPSLSLQTPERCKVTQSCAASSARSPLSGYSSVANSAFVGHTFYSNLHEYRLIPAFYDLPDLQDTSELHRSDSDP